MRTLITSLVALTAFATAGCLSVLEYPEYWEIDDSFLVNLVTFPFEILLTPIIFILKLLPGV